MLIEQFIASHSSRRAKLVLDIDATHVPLHGEQERAHFHCHYDNYCYLPLYVFAGQDLLACVLRPSDRDPASVLSALIKLLVPAAAGLAGGADHRAGRLGLLPPEALRRFERWGVGYIIGLAKNGRWSTRWRWRSWRWPSSTQREGASSAGSASSATRPTAGSASGA